VRLIRRQREQVREEALRFYSENFHNCDSEAVEPIIRTKFMSILGPILLAIAIKLAIKFIENWLAKGLSPSMVSPCYIAGEPDYEDDDGEEKTSE
jgi:hypothetical protein